MANFGRVKTWGTEVLQPTDLNAEFDNIINNITSGGVDADNIDLTDVYAWSGAHTHTNTVTVGVDDTGHDVKFFGATTGKSWLWDESADTEIITGNSTISGTLGVTGVLTATAQSVHTGGIQVGGNIVSDTDSTDDLGTSSVRWANVYTDSIGDTGQDLTIAATTTNLPSGHVTDYAGADVVLTHSAGVLNVSTGALQVGGVAVATGTGFDPTSTNTFTADQTFNDNVKLTLGTGGDADLYYDGTDVVLDPSVVGTGNFVVQISSSGADPNVKGFMVESSSSAAITIGSGTTAEGMLHFADSGAPNSGRIVYDHNTNAMYFATAATERMRIDSSGRALIGGATAGNYRVYSETSNNGWGVFTGRHTSSVASEPYGIHVDFSAASPDSNGQYFLYCEDSTTSRCIIYSDGDVVNHDGTYGTISDVKFKQDIVDARSYWDDFKSLQYRKFRHKSDVEADENAPSRLGLIAQEVETVFPALVPESPDPLVPIVDVDGEPVLDVNGEPTYEAQTYHKWVKSSIIEGPIMASVVQELMARVEALEAV
jgi:hypothetical protein